VRSQVLIRVRTEPGARLPSGRAALGEVGESVFQRPDGTAGDGGEPPWADRSGAPWRVAEERTQVAGPDGWRGRAAGRRTRLSRRAGAGAGSAAGPAAGVPGWLSSSVTCFPSGGLGGDVHVDGFERLGGDALAAVEDGPGSQRCGSAAAMCRSSRRSAGAGRDPGRERARDVPVQPQAVFQGGDQAAPLGIAGERPGPDHPEPACDLLAAGAG